MLNLIAQKKKKCIEKLFFSMNWDQKLIIQFIYNQN